METGDGRIRVKRDLQVQDIIDDMLQDFHFAHVLVLRDTGHQFLQFGVAVVHVVQQAEGIVHGGLAPCDSQTVLRHIRAVFPERPDWTYCLHVARRSVVSLRDSLLCSRLPFITELLKQTQWISELSSLYIYPAGRVAHALVYFALIGARGRVTHRFRGTALVEGPSYEDPPISSAFLTSENACLGWRWLPSASTDNFSNQCTCFWSTELVTRVYMVV